MTDEDVLSREIREHLVAAEPAVGVRPDQVRARGRRALRRRRIAVSGAAGLAVAGACLAGVVVADLSTGDGTEPSVTARTQDFSPDSLEADIRQRVDALQTRSSQVGWVEQRMEAVGRQGGLLDEAEREDATQWKAVFTSPDGDHVLDVNLFRGGAVTQDAMQRDCDSMLEEGYADVCEVDTARDGGPLRVTERATYPMGGGWPAVQESPRRAVGTSSRSPRGPRTV